MAGKERDEMAGEVARIGAGAVDQGRLAAAEKLQADHVNPGAFGMTPPSWTIWRLWSSTGRSSHE